MLDAVRKELWEGVELGLRVSPSRKPTGLAESPHSHPTPTPISFRDTRCPHSSPPGWSQKGVLQTVSIPARSPQPDPRLRSPAVTQDSGRH